MKKYLILIACAALVAVVLALLYVKVQHGPGSGKRSPSLTEATISAMAVGESGYTMPWAMYCDKQSNLWLNGDYSVASQSGGTVEMKVSRTVAGYVVDISGVYDVRREGTWIHGASYTGTPVPVQELVHYVKAQDGPGPVKRPAALTAVIFPI